MDAASARVRPEEQTKHRAHHDAKHDAKESFRSPSLAKGWFAQ
jgi:hypothetical protein